jgi:hypothetical protein
MLARHLFEDTEENLSRDRWSRGRDMNPGLLKYEAQIKLLGHVTFSAVFIETEVLPVYLRNYIYHYVGVSGFDPRGYVLFNFS